jgi:hypothetical protein
MSGLFRYANDRKSREINEKGEGRFDDRLQ